VPLPVLMYHSVSTMEPAHRGLGVPRDLLREHLHALVAEGYTLVGLTEALHREADGVVALTFDDGYEDFLTDGLEVLREVGATATLYVNPGHVGARMADRPLLSWPQIREVAAAGIEVGNHSLVHHPLDTLPRLVLDREIGESTERLAGELGAPVRSFAYPSGYHSARVRATVERYGYDNACEVGLRLHRPPGRRFAVPRLFVGPNHDGAATVALARTGGPALGPTVRRAAQPAWRVVRQVARWGSGRTPT
jgi:peptidoglycan/xylan/chitin deacetylase (PgdA/CDA1 family)